MKFIHTTNPKLSTTDTYPLDLNKVEYIYRSDYNNTSWYLKFIMKDNTVAWEFNNLEDRDFYYHKVLELLDSVDLDKNITL